MPGSDEDVTRLMAVIERQRRELDRIRAAAADHSEAAAELAADGAELVGALAAQVLAPLGAAAVVLWLLEADGTLALLGETGLSSREASRWRRVPPQPDFPAQRVAAAAPTCGGPPAVRIRGRSSVRRAGRAPCWRCGERTGSCSG